MGQNRLVKIQPTDTVLITGASGGLGIHMVRAFAQRGTRLVLVANPGAELNHACAEAKKLGSEATAIISDLRDRAARTQLVAEVLQRFGRIDILVNNAGIEFTAYYHEQEPQNILDVLGVNLEAPMLLTRLLLPRMLERRRGQVVNIASLAGKSGPAFEESYAASKAGLLAFTASLRATYRRTGVSASVIVPGFIEAGIYTDLKARAGHPAPRVLGSLPPEAVARAVLRAIEEDRPEIIVNQWPVRPLLAFSALFPRAGEWLVEKMGSNDFFRAVVAGQKKPPGK